MTEQQKTDTPSENEELLYEFWVGTAYVGSEVSEVIDLIAEGYVEDLDEWEGMSLGSQSHLLSEALEEFVWNNVESGWKEISG